MSEATTDEIIEHYQAEIEQLRARIKELEEEVKHLRWYEEDHRYQQTKEENDNV